MAFHAIESLEVDRIHSNLPAKFYTSVTLAVSLDALIPQLLGPRHCLRMPQNNSQKAQSWKLLGAWLQKIAVLKLNGPSSLI